jgi:AraC family transcriptional regulator
MPRFEDRRAMTIAGYGGKFTLETRHTIGDLWHRFAPMVGKVPGQVGHCSYGVSYAGSANGSFSYLAGVEVGNPEGLPEDFTHLAIPAGRYAVFNHLGTVTKLPETFEAIYRKWLPETGLKAAHAPCFERYTEEYDPRTQTGGTEVWIPLNQPAEKAGTSREPCC